MCYTAGEVIALQRILCLIRKNKSIIIYAVLGLLTTLVNYLLYFPLFYIAELSAALSNSIAWFFAVLFSFFTNKPFVFQSNDWSFGTLLRELIGFTGCRLLTGVLETVALLICVDVMNLNGFVCKIVVGIVVVILNYISSRIFVFRKK